MANTPDIMASTELSGAMLDAGVVAPTSAPTEANPATIHYNGSQTLATPSGARNNLPTRTGVSFDPAAADAAFRKASQDAEYANKVAAFIAWRERTERDDDGDLDLLDKGGDESDTPKPFVGSSRAMGQRLHHRMSGRVRENERLAEERRQRESGVKPTETKSPHEQHAAPREPERINAVRESGLSGGVHAGAAGAIALSVGARAVTQGFEAYMMGRVETAVLQTGETHGQTIKNAAETAVTGVGAAAVDAATGLIPGVISYREIQQGNYLQAAFWGIVDGGGLVASVITFGAAAAPVEAGIAALKATKGLATVAKVAEAAHTAASSERALEVARSGAKVYRDGNMAYTGYTVAAGAVHFAEFLETPEGKLALQALREDTLHNGISKETMHAYIATQLPPGTAPEMVDTLCNAIENNPAPGATANAKGRGGAGLRTANATIAPQQAVSAAPKPPAPALIPTPPSV